MIEENERMLVRLGAEVSGLKLVLATLAMRAAREYEDPQAFILSLTAPLQAASEGAETERERLMAEAQAELGDWIENVALTLLQN